jgi:hypothetical protein
MYHCPRSFAVLAGGAFTLLWASGQTPQTLPEMVVLAERGGGEGVLIGE